MAQELVLSAPAKINLCLHVLGRRADGYHELAMAMQRVNLCDQIHLRLASHSEVRVSCAGVVMPEGEENIAARAARLLMAEAGLNRGVEIEIDKRIPVAAGLGGGSSDAATVLMGLNQLLGVGFDQQRLLRLGAQLGADVPFFIFAEPAWATGTGTQLEQLPLLPPVAYLLVNPGIEVSTAWVYRSLELTKGGELANLPRFSVATQDQLCAALHNDLERVTLQRYPLIAELKETLVRLGALGSLMSGSGATVFGVFADLASAELAAEELRQQHDWFACPVEPL